MAPLAGCDNSPWPNGAGATNTIYSAMIENSPRHLDPTASYWSNDTLVTYQIYEPLYGYHYLKRPFELVPKAADGGGRADLPRQGRQAPARRRARPSWSPRASTTCRSSRASCTSRTRPSRRTSKGHYLYHALKPGELGDRRSPMDFEHTGTRELVADDFVYALKRHATTRIATPIYGIFSEYVIGLKDYGELIKREDAKLREGLDPASLDKPFLDFRRWPLAGATRARQAPAAHPHQGQVPAVELLDGDDLHWRRCRGRPTPSTPSRAWPSAA